MSQGLRMQRFETVICTVIEADDECEAEDCLIGVSAERIINTADRLLESPETQDLKVGCVATDIHAAAALVACVERPDALSAIVSFAGRPELAAPVLSRVHIPTLFITADDTGYEQATGSARAQLRTESELVILPPPRRSRKRASPWERQVANHAAAWFERYLACAAAGPSVRAVKRGSLEA
jgi:hypothetical protein